MPETTTAEAPKTAEVKIIPTDWASNVLIIGPSGTGKSTSHENLPTESSVIFNTENKRLPFKKNGLTIQGTLNTFEEPDHRILIGNPKDSKVEGFLQRALKAPKIEVISIDSFTSWYESLLAYCKKEHKNYEIYNHFNDEVARLMNLLKIKNKNKIVFMTGIPENVDGVEGLSERRLKVTGKQWEGLIEKEFTIVLYTRVRVVDGTTGYFFETQTDGITSAKSPKGMFKDRFIPNDLNIVVKAIKEYYS